MGRATRSICCIGLAALTGCYSYRAVPVESAPIGAGVRARVSAEQGDRLSEVLGRSDRVLEGRLVAGSDGDLVLEVPSAVQSTGLHVQRLSQRVSIPRPGVVELEVRELDRLRTAGVVALAGVAVGVAVRAAFAALDNPNDTGGGKGGVDRVLLPLWTIR